MPSMFREPLSPTDLFEELQRSPPLKDDPWQRRSPKACTSDGRRKSVRVVSCVKDEASVMTLVVVDEYGPAPRTRTLTLKSFVLGYEPGDDILDRYERISRVRPAVYRQTAPRRPGSRVQRFLTRLVAGGAGRGLATKRGLATERRRLESLKRRAPAGTRRS